MKRVTDKIICSFFTNGGLPHSDNYVYMCNLRFQGSQMSQQGVVVPYVWQYGTRKSRNSTPAVFKM